MLPNKYWNLRVASSFTYYMYIEFSKDKSYKINQDQILS